MATKLMREVSATPQRKPSDKFRAEALTFDDVLLVPAHSQVLPRDVDTTTHFSRNVTLNIPISFLSDGHRDRDTDGDWHGAARGHRRHS